MKGLIVYIVFIFFVTIIIPVTLIKGCNIVSDEHSIEKIEDKVIVTVYNVKTNTLEEMELEEYVKGVVAAEMPGQFHIEALNAQAIAARTYAIHHMQLYKDKINSGHPQAPLCTGIHCQAWYSKEELRELHPGNWMYEYWPKIEKAVNDTQGEIITYQGQPIEVVYHSTSGGMTEDSEKVFLTKVPYLRSVASPYEEEAPKLKGFVKMSVDEFISKIEGKFKSVRLTKSTLPTKIQLIEKSNSGRIDKIRIDNEIVTGREMRELFKLNSTNFKITILNDGNVEIETIGYGHGVGMSQWGANGMAEQGYTYREILKHYFTGVEIEKVID